MEFVRQALGWVFTYVFYPAAVVGIFVYVVGMLVAVVRAAHGTLGALRRATGAFLPLVVLVFVFATKQDTIDRIDSFIKGLELLYRFLIGAGAGVIVMETGKILLKTDSDGAAALYALFLSSLGVFLTWVVMGGILESLNLALLGLVVGGGMHVIFRGLPDL